MAENAILKKMKLKPGARGAVVGAPEGYVKALKPLPAGSEIYERLKGDFDWIQVFVKNEAGLKRVLPAVVRALRPESLLWISFPKGTSKIQTDLTRDKGWGSLKKYDLKWVNLISVDETWSAFALRPLKKGEKKQDWR
jgi:hypothetical protein